MILNQRLNNFVVLFPANFFSDEIKERYASYHKQLLLPYDTIEDFMTSTIQTVTISGWDMEMVQQIRMHGAEQEFKSAKPIKDLLTRNMEIEFKLSDAFLNYFIFYDNALSYLDFENKQQYFDSFRIALLNNEGYALVFLDMHKIVLHGMSEFNMSYAKNEPLFNTWKAKFKYNDWDLTVNYDAFKPLVGVGV